LAGGGADFQNAVLPHHYVSLVGPQS
jgi:hypothetical protein